MEEISAEEARRVVAEHGLPLPEIEYKGERNAEGQRHGHGTCRFADGGVYEGDVFEGGSSKRGCGTFRYASGNVTVSSSRLTHPWARACSGSPTARRRSE